MQYNLLSVYVGGGSVILLSWTLEMAPKIISRQVVVQVEFGFVCNHGLCLSYGVAKNS